MLNLKSYFNFLDRNKVYTFINLFGLSVGLMFVIVLGLYTQQEFNRDSIHRNADRIYVQGYEMIGKTQTTIIGGSHMLMRQRFVERYPDIESSCIISPQNVKIKESQGIDFRESVLCVDTNFFEFFDFPLLVGDKHSVLADERSVILTQYMAQRLFGNDSPLGKTLMLNDTVSLMVTGIVADMDGISCIRPYDIIARFDMAGKYLEPLLVEQRLSSPYSATVFLMERENADLLSKEDDMSEFGNEINWLMRRQSETVPVRIKLLPLKDLYYVKNMTINPPAIIQGNKTIVMLLGLAGLVILIFSVMNYINLTVAQSGFRMREMAMRRLLGNQRWQIMLRLMGESLFLCLIALAFAIAFTVAGFSEVNQLLNTNLRLSSMFSSQNICLALLFICLLAFICGIIPTLITSSAEPIEVVRGTFRRRTKMWLSKVFIVVQHVITIVLVAVAATMTLQIRHMLQAPLGYDTENLLNLSAILDKDKLPVFLNEVKKLTGVKNASIGMTGTPLNNYSVIFDTDESGKDRYIAYFLGDYDYMETLGIKVEKEYPTSSSDGSRTYVTRSLLEMQGLPEDSPYINMYSSDTDEHTMIHGILEDFKLGSITDVLDYPKIITIRQPVLSPTHLLVRVNGEAEHVFQDICEIYRQVFHLEPSFNIPFVKDQIKNEYKDHQRYLDLISLFALVAILISLLGLLAMSIYYIQQRKREIAIRKVFGSSSEEIMWRLVRSFVLYVVLGFVLAVPIIHYFMSDWLSQFSYRIPLYWWIFAVAGLFSLVISLLTVWVQSWKAANSNPIETIRHL